MMGVIESLVAAGVNRILMVDDDLRTEPTLKEVNECARSTLNNVEDILKDAEHEATERLVELLQQNGRPHATVAQLFEGLAIDDIREQCLPDLADPYQRARDNLQKFKEPLDKIQSWLRASRDIEINLWSSIRELAAGEFYDLLIVDYYLTDNKAEPTRKFIKNIIERHKEREHPLLVILMSSDKSGVINDLSIIRDEAGASASRFRILVKPSAGHAEPEPVVKERWLQALTQLASERALIHPIEGFVNAWKNSLTKATDTIIKRLYELDASAFSILSATAKADSMSIEEYMADVLAKRVSAETEENAEVSSHTLKLQEALSKSASTVGPTINQGVEIKDAQHAIRRLMSDVVWHRSPWHQPQSEPPAREQPLVETNKPDAARASDVDMSTADTLLPALTNDITQVIDTPHLAAAYDVTGSVEPDILGTSADNQAATIVTDTSGSEDETLTGITQDRLVWMKRNFRFGTVLREKNGRRRYFLNITQACDIQNVKLKVAPEVHYLFIRGEKLAVDRVAAGEKILESPYYAKSSTVDEFSSFHWNLRQPFTPSMTEVLESLENYSIEGQLRNESAYAVLAKFLSQASRVALLRMPKIYRCPIYLFCKGNGVWNLHKLEGKDQIHASSWEKEPGIWCNQFQLDDAYRIASVAPDVNDSIKAKSVAALGKSNTLNTEKKSAIIKLDGDKVYLARLKSNADMEVSSIIKEISNHPNQNSTKNGDVLVVIRGAEGFA